MLPDLHAQPGINVSGPALRWRAVRSSGPGGQNVNKVASKVELRVLVVSINGLTSATREHLTMIAGRRLTVSDEIIVTCSRTRDQGRNLQLAVESLRSLLVRAQELPRARQATETPAWAATARLSEKRRTAQLKRLRRERED